MNVRRVVTGVDPNGTSRVVSDAEPPCVFRPDGFPGVEVSYVWATEGSPAVPNTGEDPTRVNEEFFPPRHGSRFIVNTYPPGFGGEPPDPGAGLSDPEPVSLDRLLMHATATVDYGIVLKGEMTLVLGSGQEVRLHPMDVVVQNGADHGWRNATDEVAVVGFVILGG